MYGIVNRGAQALIVEKFGQDAWDRVMRRAQITVGHFDAREYYDDATTYALVQAAAVELSLTDAAVLNALGTTWMEFAFQEGHADLLALTGDNFLTFLQSLDSMHDAVRDQFPDLAPPNITVTEIQDHYLIVEYFSARDGLLPFFEGMLQSIAQRFDLPIVVKQVTNEAAEERDALMGEVTIQTLRIELQEADRTFTDTSRTDWYPEQVTEAVAAGIGCPVMPTQRSAESAESGIEISTENCTEAAPDGAPADLPEPPETDAERIAGLEASLNAANKLAALGEMASSIAHEINTPVQFVGDNLGFMQDLVTDLTDVVRQFAAAAGESDEIKRTQLVAAAQSKAEEVDLNYLLDEAPNAITEAIEGMQRVSELVRAMKTFAHTETEKQTADLNQCIQTTLVVARGEYKYAAEVTTDLDAQLPPVPCYAGEINQVVLNLIVNATHAIEEKIQAKVMERGQIVVRSFTEGEFAIIEVQDNGGGIPESAQPHIFERFFTTKGTGRGTGQGLAVSHEIITQHHCGSLTFHVEPSVGTTFRAAIPLNEAEVEARPYREGAEA